MKLRIKNKRKFITSLSILLTIIFILLSLISNKTYSKNAVRFKTEYVCEGETLWSIAETQYENNEYFEGKDIRLIIYEIQELNHLETKNLQIGDELLIPII